MEIGISTAITNLMYKLKTGAAGETVSNWLWNDGGSILWNDGGVVTLNSDSWYAKENVLANGYAPTMIAQFNNLRYAVNGASSTFDAIFNGFTRAGTKWVENASGVLEEVAVNTPAFEYKNGERALLLEPAGTNLFLNSAIAVTQNITIPNALQTLSFYGTGTIVVSGTYGGTLNGTGVNDRAELAFTPLAGVLTLTVTGDVRLTQFETGDKATSYIPTINAAVTRAADVMPSTGTAFSDWYNQSAGTLWMNTDVVDYNNQQYLLNVTNGTTSNMTLIQANSIYGDSGINVSILGGASSMNSTVTGGVLSDGVKLALAYELDNSVVASTGVLGTVDTSVDIPTMSQLNVGNRVDNARPFTGRITEIRYYPIRVTDSELQRVISFNSEMPFLNDANTYWWQTTNTDSIVEATGGNTYSEIIERVQTGSSLVQPTKDFQPLKQTGGMTFNQSTGRQLAIQDVTGLTNGTTGWYIALNVKPETAYGRLISFARNTSSTPSRGEVYLNSSTQIGFKVDDNDGSSPVWIARTDGLVLNTWMTLEIQYDLENDLAKFWVDGVAKTLTFGTTVQAATSFPATDPSEIVIGNKSNGDANSLDGIMDDFIFYNGVPSTDIRQSISDYLVGVRL